MAAKGSAEWKGDLRTGSGTFTAGDTIAGDYSFKSRFEDGPGANPEQLIAAAHASCSPMALSNMLAEAGSPPDSVRTDATVTLRPVAGPPQSPRSPWSPWPGCPASMMPRPRSTPRRPRRAAREPGPGRRARNNPGRHPGGLTAPPGKGGRPAGCPGEKEARPGFGVAGAPFPRIAMETATLPPTLADLQHACPG